MKKGWPQRDEAILIHPLEPAEHGSVEIEGHDRDAIFLQCVLVIEELRHFEDPSEWIMTVKPRNVEFDRRL